MKYFILLICCSLLLRAQADDYPIKPGDHVAILGNTFADQLRIHGYLETLLLERTASDPISLRNLGWAGDMLGMRDRPTNFAKEDVTLTEHKTDVVIACFGMGESFAGEAGLANFNKQLLELVASYTGRQFNGTSNARLVLVSPIAYENKGALTPNWEKRNNELSLYTDAMKEVAKVAGVGCIDLYQPTREMMGQKKLELTTNGIHLNPLGYWLVSEILADHLVGITPPWTVQIDAATRVARAEEVTLSGFKESNGGLEFLLDEQSWPRLAPPESSPAAQQFLASRDHFTIKNLPPGKYELLVDGLTVAKADHQAWAAGVAIDQSPAHHSLERYRQSVNDKNQQFIYSWKALNQVHIVGERRSSASGKELPREVIEFNQLAKQRDQALANGPELKTRTWKLVPVSQ